MKLKRLKLNIRFLLIAIFAILSGCTTLGKGYYLQGQEFEEKGDINNANIKYHEAIQVLTEQVKQGDPDAENILGVMYMKGNGVAQDIPKALSLFTSAANKGNVGAKDNINLVHEYEAALAKEKADAEQNRKAQESARATANTNTPKFTKNDADAYLQKFVRTSNSTSDPNINASFNCGMYLDDLPRLVTLSDQGNYFAVVQACDTYLRLLGRFGCK